MTLKTSIKVFPVLAGVLCIVSSILLDLDEGSLVKNARVGLELSLNRTIEVLDYFKFIEIQESSENIVEPLDYEIIDYTFQPDSPVDVRNRTQIGVENATLFMLVRNSELEDALQSMREIEDRFNRHYRYPWTFLNDVPFTEDFKKMTRGMASGKVEFGLVPEEHWGIPSHINETKMEECIADFTEREVIYGFSRSYRHMCRFNSGFFYRHPLMLQYDWYWRVEPETHFYCSLEYDPFTFMRETGKVYGFVIAIPEYPETIPTLWNTTKEFIDRYPEHIALNNSIEFVTNKAFDRPDDVKLESPNEYNLCHFWSNFEIGSLNFYRSPAYSAFFNHLDQAGGFFYERWGDAPVHTLGLSLLANSSQIHHFADIGYRHEPYYRCPHDDASYLSGRCLCNKELPGHNVDFSPISCLPKWYIHGHKPVWQKYRGHKLLM